MHQKRQQKTSTQPTIVDPRPTETPTKQADQNIWSRHQQNLRLQNIENQRAIAQSGSKSAREVNTFAISRSCIAAVWSGSSWSAPMSALPPPSPSSALRMGPTSSEKGKFVSNV